VPGNFWRQERNVPSDREESHIIYVSVNAMTPERRERTRGSVREVRHIFLDVDHGGPGVEDGKPGQASVWPPIEALEGLQSIRPGDELVLVTWLDRARRDVLTVHPRGDRARKQEGVFSTRSSDRPNPIGLHDVVITAVDGRRVQCDISKL